MSSGVQVDASVESTFKEMKEQKTMPFLVLKISDDNKKVVVDRQGEPNETFEDFRDHLIKVAKGEGSSKKDARYAVYDVYDEDDTGKNRTGKLLFVLWADDDIGIKQKMLYTSSVAAVKKKLNGYAKEMECHGAEDLSLETFREKFRK